MILKPFLSNQPYVLLLLLPILAGFCLLNVFFPYHDPVMQADLGLWGKTDLFSTHWISIVSASIVGLNALQLNRLFNRHEFLERYNYGPSLFYVVLMSFSHSFYQPDGLLIVHVCWLQALRLLFQLRTGEDNRKQVFNASLYMGIAATFLPASAAILLFFWFAVWTLKGFQFREWILSMLAFAVPVSNALVYWWFSGHRLDITLLRYGTIVRHEVIVFYTTSGMVFILFLLSLVGMRIRARKSSIRYKKLSRALFWMLIGGLFLGTADLILFKQIEWFNVLFICLSFFFTFAFLHKFWKTIATFFFYATFILAVLKFFLSAQLLM